MDCVSVSTIVPWYYVGNIGEDGECWSDLLSESQRIQYTIETQTQAIPDARTYLLTLKEIVREIPLVHLIVFGRRRKLNFLSREAGR
ncbi:hypothetical protein C3L33_12932, partial [Rhododendron williamsianum]